MNWIALSLLIAALLIISPSTGKADDECSTPAAGPAEMSATSAPVEPPVGMTESGQGDKQIDFTHPEEMTGISREESARVSPPQNLFGILGFFFNAQPGPDAPRKAATTEPLPMQSNAPPTEDPQWNLLGFIYAQANNPGQPAVSDILESGPMVLDSYYATVTKSGRATLAISADGTLLVRDAVTGTPCPAPQVLAKPTTVSRRLHNDGSRSVLIEKDSGDTVLEFPPLDDPTFTSNPFKEPLGFHPKESLVGPADGHKTVVAWWDRLWKDFQRMQTHMQQLLEKRAKLLQGLENSKDAGNERQTTLFLHELFKLDEQILGATGVLNGMKRRLDDLGTVDKVASLESPATTGADNIWCHVPFVPVKEGTVDYVSYVDHDFVGGRAGGATIGFREHGKDGVMRGWTVIFFPDGTIGITSQDLKTEVDQDGTSTVVPQGPKETYQGDPVDKFQDLKNRHWDYIQEEKDKNHITDVEKERPGTGKLQFRDWRISELIERYLNNTPEGRKKKAEEAQRKKDLEEKEKNADQLERNGKTRDANANHLEDAANDKEAAAKNESDPDKKQQLEKDAKDLRNTASEQRDRAQQDRRDAKDLYEQAAKEIRRQMDKLQKDSRHVEDRTLQKDALDKQLRDMEAQAADLQKKANNI